MNTRLLFCLLWLTPFLCRGASFTSYFLNIEAITNSVARNEMRALTSVFTNSTTVNGSLITGVANPSGLIGMSAVNGVATTLQRSDSRQAIDPAIDPTFTGSWTFAPTAADTGVVITNSAITQTPLSLRTFTGQTNWSLAWSGGGTNYGGLSGDGRFYVSDGLAASPAIAWFSDADGTGTGFYRPTANQIGVSVNGNLQATFQNASLVLNGMNVSFSGQAILASAGSGNLQLGTTSATATSQTFKGPDGTGTDKVGGAMIVAGGKSTGTAASGAFIAQTANSAGASGSSLNTYSERFHAIPKWVTLTSATATTIFTIPVPATNYVGLTATVTIYATDGTDHQSKTSVITVDAIAKTTTITPTISQVDNTTAASAGTLTCTYTAVDNTSNVLAVKATADSSLSETVLRAKIVITAINSNGTGLVTEQ